MPKKIPLMIIPASISKFISKPFIGIGSRISNIFSNVKYDLEKADIEMGAGEYFANALLNSIFFFILFFILLFILSYSIKLKTLSLSLLTSLGYSFFIFLLLFFILIKYPKIMAGKKAEQIEKNLVFALKDLLLQLSSGVTLYDGLVNVSKSGYGQVSNEFGRVARAVNSNMPIHQALEKMALTTSSEFLRRAVWQLINTIRAGASLEGALRSIIDELTIEQKNRIREYAKELNLWSLLYMLFAVAIPTIGAVLLVILSSFAGIGINNGIFIGFIVVNFAIQCIIIGFIKSRRPSVT